MFAWCEKRIHGASQDRSTTVRGRVKRFFSKKILLTEANTWSLIAKAWSNQRSEAGAPRRGSEIRQQANIRDSQDRRLASRGRRVVTSAERLSGIFQQKNIRDLVRFVHMAEGCQSGRMGYPGKVVCPKGHREFESLSLRHMQESVCGETHRERPRK